MGYNIGDRVIHRPTGRRGRVCQALFGRDYVRVRWDGGVGDGSLTGIPQASNVLPSDLRSAEVVRFFDNSGTVTAREAVPGTRIVVPVFDAEGVGWTVATVREWIGQGDGYAACFGMRGEALGSYAADHEFERAPEGR